VSKEAAVSIETLIRRIHLIRGHKVMLDSDLADLYAVPTKRLNEQVRRNRARFPADFVFQLGADEAENLRSQIATSSYGGRRHPPLAFTEHGAIMAAAVLNSRRAIQMSVFVVRAFVQLKELVSTHKLLATKLQELERKVSGQGADIAKIFDVLRELMAEPEPNKRGIGFTAQVG
jgi:hypothetical protein